jgi:acyl-CoA reductase-like NAD-dependent aldehyde dehydrogenase
VSIKIVKNYVKGQWREAENTGYLDVENPSTGQFCCSDLENPI